jgi:hypothetical protein
MTHKLVWVILMTGLAGLLYLAFRGYLAPAFLIDFGNHLLCQLPDAPAARSAASTVFSISIATVIGPTPPGTGVR